MMYKVIISIVAVIVSLALITPPACADNVEDLLQSATQNYKSENYAKALEDLNWAKQEITNKHMEVVKTLLPESLPGYETRESDSGAAFGMQNVSREYIKENHRIKISISGGETGQGGAGLGALMGMAAAFQTMDGNTKSNLVIVNGQKGQFNLETSNNHGTLTLTVNSKVFITVETWGFTDSDEAKKAAEKLNFVRIQEIFL